MRILIYSPNNLRAVDQQSQAELLMDMGHEVYLLTWKEKGELHENFEELGAKTFSASTVKGRSIFFFLNQRRFLVKFCREHQIDIVLSHLQSNAIVSGMASRSIKAKVYYFRHNSDYMTLTPSRKNKWINSLANKLSPHIVAISEKVKEELIKEGVPEKKIYRINICYNFSQYRKNSLGAASQIRSKFSSKLLLLVVARLDRLKRHTLMFEVAEALVKKGHDCKLVSIGDGPMRSELEQWVREHRAQDYIFLEPFVTNTVDYFDACDLLLQLSYSEASSHVVKEASMCGKTAMACADVGDFNDYLVNGVNAFVVDKENPVPGAVAALEPLFSDKSRLDKMGMALQKSVFDLFSIEAVRKKYEELLK